MSIRAEAFRLRDAMVRFIVPELRYSQDYYEDQLRRRVSGIGSWLDIGCGHQVLPAWRHEAEVQLVAAVDRVVGIDRDVPSLLNHRTIRHLVHGDIGALPFADESFDLVTANMVVEHLSDPARQFKEIARVLRPGGVFMLHTPNRRGYVVQISRLLPDRLKRGLALMLEGRAGADVFPTFYRANTDDEISAVARQSGFAVAAIEFTPTVPVFSAVPPLAAIELVAIRQLVRRPALAKYRHTLICALVREPNVKAN